MLVKMNSIQITDQWNVIRQAIAASVPRDIGNSDVAMDNIFKTILSGNMQCWVVVDGTDRYKASALITTNFMQDPCGRRALFVYSAFAYKPLSDDVWKDTVTTLSEWGKNNGCNNIIAFTDNNRVKQLFRLNGGRSDLSLCVIDIGGK